MIKGSILNDEVFWLVLNYLESLNEPIAITKACEQLNLPERKLISLLSYLGSFNLPYFIKDVEGVKVLVPPKMKELKVQMSVGQWLALQYHFPALDHFSQGEKCHDILVSKLSEMENEFKEHDVFNAHDNFSCSLERACFDLEKDNNQQLNLETIERGIIEKKLCQFTYLNKKTIKFTPYRIVFLEGALSVLGEKSIDNCLNFVKLDELKNVELLNASFSPQYDSSQINEFIEGIRDLNESQMRLILKVTNPDLDLVPNFEHLGKPFIAITWEGHRVWAANIEVSDKIFEWLSSLGQGVEILDPEIFKKQYLQYCEKELKKVA